jgi:hypothetical protein
MDEVVVHVVAGSSQNGVRQMYGVSQDAQGIGGVLLGTIQDCPYCTRPEGWDACPIHRGHD